MASCSSDPTGSLAVGVAKRRKRRRSQDGSEITTNKRVKHSYSPARREKKFHVANFSGQCGGSGHGRSGGGSGCGRSGHGGSGHGETQHVAHIPQQDSCSFKSQLPINEGSKHFSQDEPTSSHDFEMSRKRRHPSDLNTASDSQRKRTKCEHASTNESHSNKAQHGKACSLSPHAQRSPNWPHSPGRPPQERRKIFDKSWKDSMVHLSKFEILSMAEWPVEELVEKLSYNIKAFQYTLAYKGLLDKPGIMDALIKILSNAACSLTSSNNDLCKNGLQILTEAISDRCAVFQLQLKMYIRNDHPKHGQSIISQEKKIQCLCKLFYDILRAIPAASKFWLPVEDLQSAVEQLPNSCSKNDLLRDMEALSFHLNVERKIQLKKDHPGETNYREMDIIPNWNEVCTPQKPQLRENIVSGGYCSWTHYFDTQFRLLKEDFVAPLRRGICEYLEGGSGRKSGNIRVYKRVLLKEPMLYPSHGVCYRIKLAHQSNRIDWAHSKRLLHGSLLCLTPEFDNFKEEIFFATVVNRNHIAQGEVAIRFKKDEKMLYFSCKDTSFIMIESCALFEASQHILRALQTVEVGTMPFTKYLIKANVNVGQPRYIGMSPELQYNLSSLLTEEAKNEIQKSDGDVTGDVKLKKVIPRNQTECFLVKEVTDFQQWPTCDQTGLDASQLKGIHMALTQEIAVIQGPPGTGKTHIGLKIVDAVLSNSRICNRYGSRAPILVMCFTNHALDQFLEGILKSPVYKDVAPKLIRVGGRSKSEELAKLNLVEVRKNVSIPFDVLQSKRNIERVVNEFESPAIEAFLSATKNCVTFPLKVLEKVVHYRHFCQLFELQQTHRQSYCVLEMWLGLDTSNSHWNKIVDSTISKFEQETAPQWSSYNGKGSSDVGMETSRVLVEERGETIEQSQDDEADRKEFMCHPGSYFRALYGHCVNFDKKRAQKILRYGFTLVPMSEKESRNIPDILNLSFEDRWRLYQFWHSQYLKHFRKKCEKDFLKYENLCSKLADARRVSDCFALETANIIGMTTTGVAKNQQILHRVKPKIIIVEEAAEVLESHIVSALNANTQHLILIGDHKQLRPKPNEYELAKKYQFDVSLFERLVRNGFPHTTLECQHRMRPEIAELIKPHIYPVLSNHSSVESYPDIRGVSTNLFFIKHNYPEEEDQNLMSHSNDHEAKYLVSLCQYILQQEQYTPENITILVTYAGQQRRVRKLISESNCKCLIRVRVDTVDNFQGEENNIILLSLVRSNSEKIVGFLKEENRICVALSRAQHGFYCIGDFDMLQQKVPLWERVVADMEGKGKLGEGLLLCCSNHPEKKFVAKLSEDFEKNSPEGGCLLDCNSRLECGHTCTLKCHFTDSEHVNYECKKKCSRLCPQGHPCCKPCFVPCKCEVRVTKMMPHCQHEQEMPCSMDPSNVDCNRFCENKCPKGHGCPHPCHQKSQEECPPCVVKVPFITPSCHHKQLVKCHLDTAKILCRAKCSRKCAQGHQCHKLCHEVCGACVKPVLKVIEVCKHAISLPCHVEPIHSECTKPCEKVLRCGHKCQLECGEDCSASLCMEVVTAEFPDCGHKIQVPCHVSHDLSRKSDVPLIQCKVLVTKKWPCGHLLRRPCYKTAGYPCLEACNKDLACGHRCTKQCGQACDDKCQYICKQVLSCGHKCQGQCSQCTTEHMHKLCPFKTEVKRFCGHSFEISCSGLMDDHPGSTEIPITCCHRSRQIRCFEEARDRCRERCLWRCPHFQCQKLCYEMCDRRRCNKRCMKKLKCGHPCIGLCGEPCLTLCPLCGPKLFKEKLCVGKFSKDIVYYELDCKHIFPVEYLDKYVRQITNSNSHMLVCPVQCPAKECSRPFNRSYRYGNDAKRLLPYIQDIDALLSVNPNHEDMELLNSQLNSLLSNETTSSIISICRLKMKNSASLSIDEIYIIFIFTEVISIFDVLDSAGTGVHYKKTMEETESFLKTVSNRVLGMYIFPTRRPKLTHQFVGDLRRKFFSLYLQVYILLVKSGRKLVLPGANSHHRVDSTDFDRVALAPSSQIDTLSGIDSSSFPTQASTCDTESGGISFSEDEKSPSHDAAPLADTLLSVEPGILGSLTQPLNPKSTSDTESGELSDSEDEKSLSHDTDSLLYSADSTLIVSGGLPSVNSEGQLDNSAPPSLGEDQLVSSDKDSSATLGTECPMLVEPSDPKLQTNGEDMLKLAEVESAIVAAEEFLKNVPVTVTKSDITAHCEAMGKLAVLDYKKMLEGMDRFYPVVQKGQWWRCPIDKEYYCLPPFSTDEETKCPNCNGLYKRTIEVFCEEQQATQANQGRPNEKPASSFQKQPGKRPSKHRSNHRVLEHGRSSSQSSHSHIGPQRIHYQPEHQHMRQHRQPHGSHMDQQQHMRQHGQPHGSRMDQQQHMRQHGQPHRSRVEHMRQHGQPLGSRTEQHQHIILRHEQAHRSPMERQMGQLPHTSEWQPRRQVEPYDQPSRSQMEHRLGPRLQQPTVKPNHKPHRKHQLGANESMHQHERSRGQMEYRLSPAPREWQVLHNPDQQSRRQPDHHAARWQHYARNVFDRLGR